MMKQEAILLDLLRVISHHRARLATPIRTVQKIYSDTDLENVPFADSIYSRGGMPSNRPLLLIEPSYRINGEDKAKSQARSGRGVGDQENRGAPRSASDTKTGGSPKSDPKAKETQKSENKVDARTGETPNSHAKDNIQATTASTSDPKIGDKTPVKSTPNSVPKTSNSAEASSSESKAAGLVSNNVPQNKKISNQPKSVSPGRQNSQSDNPSVSLKEAGTDKASGLQQSSQLKQGAERQSVTQPSVSRPALEENLVLGVALQGSKRTLPIDEDMNSHSTSEEAKEMAAAAGRNGAASPTGEKDGKDDCQNQTPPSSTSANQWKLCEFIFADILTFALLNC